MATFHWLDRRKAIWKLHHRRPYKLSITWSQGCSLSRFCFSPLLGSYFIERWKDWKKYLWNYWSTVLQTWHQICSSQKKTNDTQCHCHGNSLSPSHFLSKTKYPHFQPFKSATEGPWGDIHVKEWCQLSRRILLVIMICISYFQGLEISFPKITQVVKFQQKSPAHQLPVSAQGLHLNHKGLRELKKLWRTSGCPLLAAALGINRFV